MKKTLLFAILFTIFTFRGMSQWISQANYPEGISQEGAVSHPNGNVYLWGGYIVYYEDTLFIFNSNTNTWTGGAIIPYPGSGMAYTLGPDSMIYSLSGYDFSNHVNCYKYNVNTNTWITLANIPKGVWYGAAATAPNGKIYVFGGESTYTLVQVYDPVADSWTKDTAAPIPTGVKMEAAIAAQNGKIYLIGGMTSADVAIDSVQIFDPVINTFSRGTPMPVKRNQFGYAMDGGGKIWCIGGKTQYANDQSPFFKTVEIYDPSTDSWTTYPDIPNVLGETVAAYSNNGINVFAGADDSTEFSQHNFRTDSSALTAIAGLSANEEFNVYPNPSNGIVTLLLASSNNIKATVHIEDITGQIIYQETFSNFIGGEQKQINMSGFSKGIYFVEFVTDKSRMVKKLVIE